MNGNSHLVCFRVGRETYGVDIFTVREIVRMGLSTGLNNDAAHAQAIAAAALAAVDLEGFEGRFYQELSGGEQQRVQLARVLTQIWDPVLDGRPCFLMLDEPVSSLDIRHQLTIMQLARDYCLRGGGVILRSLEVAGPPGIWAMHCFTIFRLCFISSKRTR